MVTRSPEDVRLVVADVDGTLVTPDKILTARARAAVRAIIEAGIAFTITSGRPPRGMKMLIDELEVRHPITAFNGGLFVWPDLSVIRERLVPRELVRPVMTLLTKSGLDVWIYTANDWRVSRATVRTSIAKSGLSSFRQPSCRHLIAGSME